MKLTILSLLLAASTLGVTSLSPERQVLITYPSDTPASTISEAKSTIESAVSPHFVTLEKAANRSIKGWEGTTRVP